MNHPHDHPTGTLVHMDEVAHVLGQFGSALIAAALWIIIGYCASRLAWAAIAAARRRHASRQTVPPPPYGGGDWPL